MGADIHMVLERRAKVRDKETWIGINAFPYVVGTVYDHEAQDRGGRTAVLQGTISWSADGRNYGLFAALAGVRGQGPAPKGVPDDASDLALMMIDDWGSDGHSHTWWLMDEALPLFIQHGQLGKHEVILAETLKHGTGRVLDQEMRHFWSVGDDDDLRQYRLVLWFDN